MVDYPLKPGQDGPDIVSLQRALNRLGALLVEDGDYGPATTAAVRNAQSHFGWPETGAVDQAFWNKLMIVPEPSPLLPTRGVCFIAIEEISSRARYDAAYCHPVWPGGSSGITIGVGFDLRHATAEVFARDWAELDDQAKAALTPWLGVKGSQEGADSLKDVVIPFDLAWPVYCGRTLPVYVNQTADAFPGYDALPGLCKSALVSLVYNRGPDMDGQRRAEMRAIRDLVSSGKAADLAQVPAQFEAMVRLWPDGSGLRGRRKREGKLWSAGLAG